METVVPQSPRGQPLERRGTDRAAEATWVTETRIVGEDQQDVRRTVWRGQRRDVIPVRLRAVERPLHRALKRRTPNGQPGAVYSLVAHVPSLLCVVVAYAASRAQHLGRRVADSEALLEWV